MPIFIMTVGLPASGKSTWCEEYMSHINTDYISSDEYREIYFDNVNDQNHNTIVFQKMFEDTIEALNNGKNVLYDATNLNYKRRMHLVSEINRICHNVFYMCKLFATPYEQCLKNNAIRERKVPEDVIKQMYLNFYVPAYYEGWDNIDIVWWENSVICISDIMMQSRWFNQNNSHHSLTLGTHLHKAFQHCIDISGCNTRVCTATFLHDIGKIFTKSFTNFKGEPTSDAHYFNHQNVGAYDSLFVTSWKFDTNSILHIANLIQWHMQPYFMETDKSKKKFLNLVGQEFYDEIMILHECDEFAH